MIPLALVGVSFRETASAARAALRQFDDLPDSPTQELLARGLADGVVRIETCARVEWLVSAHEPRWAADLLASSLRRAAATPLRLRIHCEQAAAVALLRMSIGLDSVAQGEYAIGRQVIRAFERAHRSRRTDRVLRLCWRRVAESLETAHTLIPRSCNTGVQTLVVQHLADTGLTRDAAISIFGCGEMGRAVRKALEYAGYVAVTQDARDSLERFRERTQRAHALIVCSGAPSPWLELPERHDSPLAIDIGSPDQIRSAPGWRKTSLDDLLTSRSATLPDDTLTQLEQRCVDESSALCQAILAPSRAESLRTMAQLRSEFLSSTLPPLLSDVPPQRAKEIAASIGAVMHKLLLEARGRSS
jgi:glutamyl-tRNA reductase